MGGAGSSPGFLWRRGRRERGGEEVSKGEVPPGIPQGGLSPFFFTVDVFFELKVICDQVCLGSYLHFDIAFRNLDSIYICLPDSRFTWVDV